MYERSSEAVWDPTYPAYYQLADVLKSVAEAHCGVKLDTTTLLRWREVMGIMREIDTHADDTATPPQSIIKELSTFERFRGRYPHLTPESLQFHTHSKLIERTGRILQLGRSVAAATTPYRYIRLRAAEAVNTAELFADSATEEVRYQPEFRGEFMPLLRSLGIAACMLDSAHDIGNDYHDQKAALKPTIGFRILALAASARHTAPFLAVCIHKPVRTQLQQATHIRADRKIYSNTYPI